MLRSDLQQFHHFAPKGNPWYIKMETEEYILSLVTAHTLLLLDRGFYHFSFWLKLIEQKVDFVTRLKKGAAIQVEQVFTDSYEEARQKGVVVSVHYPKKVCGLTTSFNG